MLGRDRRVGGVRENVWWAGRLVGERRGIRPVGALRQLTPGSECIYIYIYMLRGESYRWGRRGRRVTRIDCFVAWTFFAETTVGFRV